MSKKLRDLLNKPKKLIAAIRQEKAKSKMKIKKVQSKCPHQDNRDRLWVHPKKGGNGTVCKCDECKKKINLAWLAGKTPEEIGETIKDSFKLAINIIDATKIQLSVREDKKELAFLGDVQYGLVRAQQLCQACCADTFEVHRKKKGKKKNKKKKGKKLRLGTAGRTIGFGRK